jgi:hypothetical protein
MKKIFSIKYLPLFLAMGISLLILSCRKDTDGSPENKPGNPVSAGISPDSASGGSVITLKGSGLGDMRTIVFDKNNVPASFQPNLSTENSLVFRVPDTAFGGPQHIVFTNSNGNTLSVPFKVIALPGVSSASTTDFEPGTQITLTGNNLDDVSSVVIDGTSDAATIISKTRKQMVIQMPATSVERAKLRITNSSGFRVTDLEFTNIPKSFSFFTENFDNGIQDWSWASTHQASNEQAFMGTKSIKAIYGSGGWQAISLHRNDPKIAVSDYKYLTFYVKGGTADQQFEVFSENGGSHKTITVPANVWTYYKLTISEFMAGVMLERLDFQIHGPNGGDQTIYFDNILFVK